MTLKILTLVLISASAFAQAQDELLIEATPLNHVRRQNQRASALSLPPVTYNPYQIRQAYGLHEVSETGAGQTIAIINAYGSSTAQEDLATFSSTFGLPEADLRILYPQGLPETSDAAWALETALDIQWAHAMAPSATILLVVAKSATFADLLEAVDAAVVQGATIVSMSWGASEFPNQVNYNYHFNVPGVSFFAASGDNGTGTLWPSTAANVTAVGGTSLRIDENGFRLSETAWSGSGGGISKYEPKPDYQKRSHNYRRRTVPDVSYNADPNTGFYVFSQGSWYAVGGTSAGAPQWAAIAALANSRRSTSLSYLNHTIYSIGKSSEWLLNFVDVISGCNFERRRSYTCAKRRFDAVTGFGSPISPNLLTSLSL